MFRSVKQLASIVTALIVSILSSSCAQRSPWSDDIKAGETNFQQGNYDEAERYFIAARAQLAGISSKDPRQSETLRKLADTYVKEEKYPEALAIYDQRLVEQEREHNPNPIEIAETLNSMARVKALHHEFQSAEPLFQKALSIREQKLGAGSLELAETENDFADMYLEKSDYAKADMLYRKALVTREEKLGPKSLEVAVTLGGMGKLAYQRANQEEGAVKATKLENAEKLLARALSIKETTLGHDHPDLVPTLDDLGWTFQVQKKLKDAEIQYRRAIAIEQNKGTEKSSRTLSESENYLTYLYMQYDDEKLLKPNDFDGFHYVPEVYKDSPKGFKLFKGKQLLLERKLDKDYPYEYASIKLAFPLAKARLLNEFDPDGAASISTTDDVLTRVPPINNLFSKPEPGVIVATFSGGMNSCCTDYELFRLGDKATKLPSLEGRHVYEFTFGDFHGDGHLQALGCDMSFCYWNCSMPESPRPTVVLNYTPSGWKLSVDDMRIDTIPPKDIEKALGICNRARQREEKEYPPQKGVFHLDTTVWRTMLNLIYAGHANDAWAFLDKIWPDDLCCDKTEDNSEYYMTKEAFLKNFKSQLSTSPYWQELHLLNKSQTM